MLEGIKHNGKRVEEGKRYFKWGNHEIRCPKLPLNPHNAFEAGTISVSPFQRKGLKRLTRLLKKVIELGYQLGRMDSGTCIPNPYAVLTPQ